MPVVFSRPQAPWSAPNLHLSASAEPNQDSAQQAPLGDAVQVQASDSIIPAATDPPDPPDPPSSLHTQNDSEDLYSHNRLVADYHHLHSEYSRLYADYKAKEQQLTAKEQTIAAQTHAINARDASLATRSQEVLTLEKKYTDIRASWNEYREANEAYQAEFGRKNLENNELKQALARQKALTDKNWGDAVMYKQYMEAAEQKKVTFQAENEKLLAELNQVKYDVVQQKNLVTSWSTQGGSNYQKLARSIEKHFEGIFRRWQEGNVGFAHPSLDLMLTFALAFQRSSSKILRAKDQGSDPSSIPNLVKRTSILRYP